MCGAWKPPVLSSAPCVGPGNPYYRRHPLSVAWRPRVLGFAPCVRPGNPLFYTVPPVWGLEGKAYVWQDPVISRSLVEM